MGCRFRKSIFATNKFSGSILPDRVRGFLVDEQMQIVVIGVLHCKKCSARRNTATRMISRGKMDPADCSHHRIGIV